MLDDLVANMEVDMVADMEVDMLADVVADMVLVDEKSTGRQKNFIYQHGAPEMNMVAAV